MAFPGDDRGGPAGAVGDRTGDMCGPDRCPVLANGWTETRSFQLLQRRPRADPSGEKLRLPFRDGTLDARRRFDGAALEIIAKQ
ncbi:hypothetical protein D9M71_806830 [compost metagenome]